MSRHEERSAECEGCGAVYTGARAIRSYTKIVWIDEGLETEEGFTVCREGDCEAKALWVSVVDRRVDAGAAIEAENAEVEWEERLDELNFGQGEQ